MSRPSGFSRPWIVPPWASTLSARWRGRSTSVQLSSERLRIDGTAHPDRRSLAGHTDDRHVTADQVDTFLHGDQPETAAVVSHGGHVEALAVVHHCQVELLALA